MKKIGIIVFVALFTLSVTAQEERIKQKFILETIVEPPVFVGEMGSTENSQSLFISYLTKELNYLTEDNSLFEEGVVAVEFTVNADASITNLNVTNSVSRTIDQSVVDILSQTDNMWLPGRINGQASEMNKKVFVKFDAPGNPNHNQMAINYLNLAIKQYYAVNQIENNQFMAASKKVKKINRKCRTAEYHLISASKYKPDDLSITFWQARNYEQQGKVELMHQSLDKYLELVELKSFEQSIDENNLAIITKF